MFAILAGGPKTNERRTSLLGREALTNRVVPPKFSHSSRAAALVGQVTVASGKR